MMRCDLRHKHDLKEVRRRAGRTGPRLGHSMAVLGLATMLLAGCSSLLPAPSPQPSYFALQMSATARQTGAANPPSGAPRLAAVTSPVLVVPVLVVQVPRAAPGFDGAHIIYTRQPHRLEQFARHEWVDTPVRMLAPLMVAALDGAIRPDAGFRAVVLAPSVATGTLQLDTQLVRLQQEFGAVPSRVRLTLRAQLIHTASRQVLATCSNSRVASSTSEDAPGGVAAAQVAVQALLVELAAWCQTVATTPR
jgi:cholesterol transport system auxiliary component